MKKKIELVDAGTLSARNTAIPAAHLLEKAGFKRGIMIGFCIMALGALIFIPAAMTRTYGIFLLGLILRRSSCNVFTGSKVWNEPSSFQMPLTLPVFLWANTPAWKEQYYSHLKW